MSTRIDINVAGDLLRRLNRSQSQANRQSLLERERRGKLAQQGTTVRQQQNLAQGRAADGRPLGRRPFRPRFLEEPAATPLPVTPYFVLVPRSDYIDGAIPAQVRRLAWMSFASSTASPGLTVDLTGGPIGTGSLSGLSRNRATCSLTYGELLSTPHTIEAIINMNTLEDIEFPGDSDMGFSYNAFDPTSLSDYGGISLIWYMTPLYSGTQIAGNRGSEIKLSGLIDDIHIVSDDSMFYANRIVNPAVHAPGEWRHLAYEYIPPNKDGQITESVYFNGALVYTATDAPGYVPTAEDLASPTRFSLGTYDPTFASPRLPKIHGYRMTTRALYRGRITPFDPPIAITGFPQ